MARFPELKGAFAATDPATPLVDRLHSALRRQGLGAQHDLVRREAPDLWELAEEALCDRLKDDVKASGDGGGQVSRRSWAETRNRQRQEAAGQLSLGFDFKGEPTGTLRAKLSFAEYFVHGRMVDVGELLADSVARSAVLAALAAEESDLCAQHAVAERDLRIWQELCERASLAEIMVDEAAG